MDLELRNREHPSRKGLRFRSSVPVNVVAWTIFLARDYTKSETGYTMPRKDLHEKNRLSWNAAMPAQNSHKHDQAAFLRAGGSSLAPFDVRTGSTQARGVVSYLRQAAPQRQGCSPSGMLTLTGSDVRRTIAKLGPAQIDGGKIQCVTSPTNPNRVR